MIRPEAPLSEVKEQDNPVATAVCIGTDAFRIAVGIPPRNYSVEDVIRWLRLMAGRN